MDKPCIVRVELLDGGVILDLDDGSSVLLEGVALREAVLRGVRFEHLNDHDEKIDFSSAEVTFEHLGLQDFGNRELPS